MDNQHSVEWIPDKRTAVVMNIVGLVLTAVSLAGFMSLYAMNRPEGAEGTLEFVDMIVGLVVVVVLTLALTIVHELLHGFALKTLGFRAKYGTLMVGKVVPAFYCTAPGAIISKAAFVYVALLPGIVLAIIPAVWIAANWPGAGWLVLPSAFLFGGAVGDFFMTTLALRTPKGTKVEDLRDGVRFHYPNPA